MRKLAFLLVILVSLPALSPAKDKPGKAKGRPKEHAAVESRVFLPHHHTVIVDYCRRPAFAAPAALPPGLARQLRRNGRLPPGLEKKLVFFPPDLDRSLPAVAPGYQRGFIGQFAVVWSPRTRVIVDIVAVR